MKPCAWCGEPSVREAEIEPPARGTKKFLVVENGVAVTKTSKVMRKAITVPVCKEHGEMVDRNRAERDASDEADREHRRKLKAERTAKARARRAA